VATTVAGGRARERKRSREVLGDGSCTRNGSNPKYKSLSTHWWGLQILPSKYNIYFYDTTYIYISILFVIDVFFMTNLTILTLYP
jgi:hypothetical protein